MLTRLAVAPQIRMRLHKADIEYHLQRILVLRRSSDALLTSIALPPLAPDEHLAPDHHRWRFLALSCPVHLYRMFANRYCYPDGVGPTDRLLERNHE